MTHHSRHLFSCVLMTAGLLSAAPLQTAQAGLFTRHQEKEVATVAPGSFADLADRLLPAVVNISSTQKITNSPEAMPDLPQFPPGSPFEDFFEEFMNRRGGRGVPQIPPASLGSGFIVDAENGYIVTNNHVIRDAEEVRVTLHDDTTLTAEIIGTDEKTDIAVLKVNTTKKLTAVPFGNSDKLRVGDWVLAIGNPFGLGGTVTAGIVSARQRDINSGPYDDFIQTDASINRGNSGGPMFDMDGGVIGINTAIFSPSGGSVGIGFAIPSALAEPVIKQIIEYGRTRRGWLGVKIQTVTDEIAESLSLDKARGALVASVNASGPADKGGLQAGDIILKFNGHDIDEMRVLPRVVAETKIDEDVPVEIWRNGKVLTKTVKVGELEKAEEAGLVETSSDAEVLPAKEEKLEEFGLSVSDLEDALRDEFSVPDNIGGVVVVKVENLSEAAEKGLLPGDVIVEMNQKKVNNVAQLKEVLEAAKADGKPSVLLLLNREGNVRFTALKLKPKKDKS
ncbi:MAG: DegQ family serine endoprotease [Rhodospirillales bacterium]|nr:DegQ family serine endoprotease [Rhodospirillales bacterium]MCB9965736.1 DegQ family serine endoprotease [Rhodospirillales bacterium]MCB9979664.1 DegQ family serine endoprotease [Rhodospirillales bacterium]